MGTPEKDCFSSTTDGLTPDKRNSYLCICFRIQQKDQFPCLLASAWSSPFVEKYLNSTTKYNMQISVRSTAPMVLPMFTALR